MSFYMVTGNELNSRAEKEEGAGNHQLAVSLYRQAAQAYRNEHWYAAAKVCEAHAKREEAKPPTLTKRLSWRTKNPQFFQSFGCGQVHVIHFAGTCESCGRSVYSHGCQGAKPCGDLVTDSPDPRGIIPAEHCLNLYRASEYDLKGRDLITCAACADDGDRYRAIIAQAKYKGIWTRPEVIGYLCGICGKSGPEHGHYDATDPNTHKFICGEEVTN